MFFVFIIRMFLLGLDPDLQKKKKMQIRIRAKKERRGMNKS